MINLSANDLALQISVYEVGFPFYNMYLNYVNAWYLSVNKTKVRLFTSAMLTNS